MSDTNDPAPLQVERARPSLIRRLSLVWLVPVLALAVSLGVAWRNYANQGVLVEISFENASGVTADETEIKYRDVTVGRVEGVEFSEGLGDVIVVARIDPDIAPYLDQDAQFWVVRPDVSVRGISGLDTVLSGVYIEGTWNDDADVQQYEFTGLEVPPLTRANQAGTEIVLRTTDGSALSAGAPVLHKGIEVGYLETPRLASDGQQVTVSAFIEEPYDSYVTTNTRFWDTSGFSVSFGANGLALDVNSVASIIEGGVAFDTVVSGGEAIAGADGIAAFDLFEDEDSARNSLFNDPDTPRLFLSVLFDESVAGLSAGSDVTYQGIRVGSVTALGAVAIETEAGNEVQLRATLGIEPGRLGLSPDATPEDALEFIGPLVEQGLRARLTTGNILSGSLNVQLLNVPDAPPARLSLASQPYPVLPTTESAITDVADQAEGVLDRINNLPIEELLQSAIDLMDSVERVASSEAVRETPEEVVQLLRDARTLVGSEAIQAVPDNVASILGQIDGIVAQVGEDEIVASIATALASANAALAEIDSATDALPAITAEIEALTAKANALELQSVLDAAIGALSSIDTFVSGEDFNAIPTGVNALLGDARGLIASEELQAVPGQIGGVLTGANDVIASLNEQQLAARLGTAIDTANTALADVNAATADLPALTEELRALTAKANALELEGVLNAALNALSSVDTFVSSSDFNAVPGQINAVLGEAQALIASEDIQAIPGGLRTTVAELNRILAAFDEAQAVEKLIAVIEAANSAATSIDGAAQDLPQITDQLRQLSERANTLDLDGLVAEAQATLGAIDQLLSDTSEQGVPAALSGALDELRLLIAQVNEGGAIENVNAALASANDAAQAIGTAAASLPELSRRAGALVTTTDGVLQTYADRSRFNAETLATLRDIQEAADAISNLARTIQRNPSSLLTGR